MEFDKFGICMISPKIPAKERETLACQIREKESELLEEARKAFFKWLASEGYKEELGIVVPKDQK